MSVEAYPNGRSRYPVLVWQIETAEQLAVEDVNLVARSERAALLQQLPEDHRAEAERLLKELASDVARGKPATPTAAGSRRVEPLEAGAPRPPLNVASSDRATRDLAWDLFSAAQAAEPQVFLFERRVVALERGTGHLRLRSLSPDMLRTRMDHSIAIVHGDSQRPCSVPRDMAALMLAEPEPPLPTLTRIAHAPIVDRNGRIRWARGYDAEDRVLLDLDFEPLPVDTAPSVSAVREARRLLERELLGDFPFATEADRANALGLLLLPFLREVIAGPTPLHLVEAPTPGSGKSKLGDACLRPALGEVPHLTFPKDPDETRKRITAALSEGASTIFFDNVNGSLRPDPLAQALTDSVWSDRQLGSSTQLQFPVRCIWVATANNPTVHEEIVRRTVSIRLVPTHEAPEERTGFRHPDLDQWSRDHRAQLAWAALTLVSNWLSRDRPAPPRSVPQFGSFEAYRYVVGGVLAAADVVGFLGTRDRLRSNADPEREQRSALIRLWAERFGEDLISATKLLPLADEVGLRVNGESEKARATSLGQTLTRWHERVTAGFKVSRGMGAHRREWALQASTHDTSDTSDTSLVPYAREEKDLEDRGLPPSEGGWAGEVPHGATGVRGVIPRRNHPQGDAWEPPEIEIGGPR